MKYTDISTGMIVYYVPTHADNNLLHPDTEKGIVTSKNDQFIFVRFGSDSNSKACKAEQLF